MQLVSPQARIAAAVSLMMALHATVVRAERDEADPFWSDVSKPAQKRFRALVEQGKAVVASASRMQDAAAKRKVLSQALSVLQQALAIDPKASVVHYWLGAAFWELDRMPEAVGAYVRARELDPALSLERDADIAWKLGLAYSKTAQFESAVREYLRADAALARQGRRAERSLVNCNVAECLMALGRLDESLRRYRQGLSYQPGSPLRAACLWGLAVALDRDEQLGEARAVLQEALDGEANNHRPTMSTLSDPGTFFVPPGDVNYYYALGYSALGRRAEALDHWRRFIDEVKNSPWLHRAREHVRQLGDKSAVARRLAPQPSQLRDHENVALRNAIRYRLGALLNGIHGCYKDVLKVEPNLSGRLRLRLMVQPGGKLTGAKIEQSTFHRRDLHACMLKVAGATNLGRMGGAPRPVSIVLPLEFKP